MTTERNIRVQEKILKVKAAKGGYYILSSHFMMMDYSVRLSYNEFLGAVARMRASELDGSGVDALTGSLRIIANARFFFESIYGFVYMFERLSKEKSGEPMVLLLKELFNKYKTLKMPRVKVTKDNFNELIWAEAVGDKDVIEKLTGESKFLYEFSTDATGQIRFQGEDYDPHEYFRIYTDLIKDLEKGLDRIIGCEN